MKARPSLWNLRPLGQPSYCTTRSHSFCGEMRKMRPNGMSTIQRLPSRSNDGPSRKHSTSAPWRLGSDQAVRLLWRNCLGRDVNTSALISSGCLNGLSMASASFSCPERKPLVYPMDFSLVFEVSCTPAILRERYYGQYWQCWTGPSGRGMV